jgi:hypothetical protein
MSDVCEKTGAAGIGAACSVVKAEMTTSDGDVFVSTAPDVRADETNADVVVAIVNKRVDNRVENFVVKTGGADIAVDVGDRVLAVDVLVVATLAVDVVAGKKHVHLPVGLQTLGTSASEKSLPGENALHTSQSPQRLHFSSVKAPVISQVCSELWYESNESILVHSPRHHERTITLVNNKLTTIADLSTKASLLVQHRRNHLFVNIYVLK